MKKHYPWLFFDADGTLFDYDRAEATALRKSFALHDLQFEAGYLDTYRQINHGLWQALERQEIKQDVLRVRRFELLLQALQLQGSPDQFSTTYVEQLGLCTDLIEGAYEVLQSLHETSRIAIVTNGLQAVQRSRLEHSSIRNFITELIISEEVGAAKPGAAYFEAAFAKTGHPDKREVLIIGDSLSSDIQGGADYGLDTCWYNPTEQAKPDALRPVTYEIRRLRELLELVD
ncbi:MAG TPA: YjjG family noncanonical pyrimidine nucleotidase [Anaerolineales bacterium]|nr:YjjG family noncanonical pyrimidine nucleotidase [Anaerolineales bacterium]